jgi:hypothetical protein
MAQVPINPRSTAGDVTDPARRSWRLQVGEIEVIVLSAGTNPIHALVCPPDPVELPCLQAALRGTGVVRRKGRHYQLVIWVKETLRPAEIDHRLMDHLGAEGTLRFGRRVSACGGLECVFSRVRHGAELPALFEEAISVRLDRRRARVDEVGRWSTAHRTAMMLAASEVVGGLRRDHSGPIRLWCRRSTSETQADAGDLSSFVAGIGQVLTELARTLYRQRQVTLRSEWLAYESFGASVPHQAAPFLNRSHSIERIGDNWARAAAELRAIERGTGGETDRGGFSLHETRPDFVDPTHAPGTQMVRLRQKPRRRISPSELPDAGSVQRRRELERATMDTSYKWLNEHLGELYSAYGGKFVAIAHNRVVDTDSDYWSLSRRVRQAFPDVPVLIEHMNSEHRHYPIAVER